MSGWNHDDMGDFPSEQAAIDWAHRNNIDLRDIHMKHRGGVVEVGLRRSTGRKENELDNRYGGRSDGFFQ